MNLTKSILCSAAIFALTLYSPTLRCAAQEIEENQPTTNSTAISVPDALEMPPESTERQQRVRKEVVFAIGHDAEVKADEFAETVVVIGGTATIHGRCKECVTIGGDIKVDGEVQHSTVAVLGGIKVGPGGRLGRA